jgi:hypothetical protein
MRLGERNEVVHGMAPWVRSLNECQHIGREALAGGADVQRRPDR